jgi:hypothetical protein
MVSRYPGGEAFPRSHRVGNWLYASPNIEHQVIKVIHLVPHPQVALFRGNGSHGDELGRRSSRPGDCHVQMVQRPSSVPLPELGQASLVFGLADDARARRVCLQARPLERDGYLTYKLLFLNK